MRNPDDGNITPLFTLPFQRQVRKERLRMLMDQIRTSTH
jgi:hypothetical protein